MFLRFFVLLLPVVISSAINPFEKFTEPGFIKNTFIEFLTVQERMRFALTCRRYYHEFMEIEYDQLINEIPGPYGPYKTAQKSLKADIRKLWRYFKLEMIARKRNEPFKIDNFYEMIAGSFFTADSVKSVILNENAEDFNSFIGVNVDRIRVYTRPNFPEISLILFKSETEQTKKDQLIKNALLYPYLFDPFFKHLTENVYKISRNELVTRTRSQYPNWNYPISIEWYQWVMWFYLNVEDALFGVILSIPIVVISQFFPKNLTNHLYSLALGYFVIIMRKLLKKDHKSKYESFAKYNPRNVKLFFIITRWMYDFYYRYLSRRNNHH